MNTEATLLTGKVETPKRALALKLALAICALTALVGAIATPRASGHHRAARGGACRSDQTKIEPRGGTHYTQARGGVGVRELPVAIIIPVLRGTFYHS